MSNTFNVIAWMAEHGHPGYAHTINTLRASRDEVIGDAGRYWQDDPATRLALARIDGEIAEIERAAADRYEDWATDPLE